MFTALARKSLEVGVFTRRRQILRQFGRQCRMRTARIIEFVGVTAMAINAAQRDLTEGMRLLDATASGRWQ